MITTNIPNSTSISALNAKVDVQTESALVTCTCGDYLQDFVLHREGDSSKFFGFGISHKLDVVFIDLDRRLKEAPVEKGNTIKIALGSGDNFDYPYPTMYITELSRNEKTSNITCVAYDALFKATIHKVSELNIKLDGYTLEWPMLGQIVEKCAEVLGLSGIGLEGLDNNNEFNFEYLYTANLDGSESLKELLDDIAEFTQTIYYINSQNKLVFKQLDKTGSPVLTVDKDMYFELTTLTPRTITGVCHATDLGNNLTTEDDSGIIQIMRNNAFFEMYAGDNEDALQTKLNIAANRVSGLTFTQLECEWDGNHCLEIGDKVAFVTDDDTTVTTYIINDIIEYQGFLNEITSWEYTQDENETDANPTNLGEKVNQTYAKVDKINKEISLLAKDVDGVNSEIAEIKLTTNDINLRVEKIENLDFDLNVAEDKDFKALAERVGQLEITDENITASVSTLETTIAELDTTLKKDINDLDTSLRGEIQAGDSALEGEITTIKQNISELAITDAEIKATVSAVEQTVANSSDSINKEIETLTKEVNLKISSEDVTIAISKSLSEGVDKVVTSTKKYTFDDTGLSIGDSSSEISTIVSEDGMKIYKQNTEVLVADNQGVKAEDLHATTYLIIGNNSRLEDWQNNYTACFWIGGNN